MTDFKLGEKVVCYHIYKGETWQNYTIGKVYTIMSGDRLCPLIIIDDNDCKIEPNWYQFISLSKMRKNKLKKLEYE